MKSSETIKTVAYIDLVIGIILTVVLVITMKKLLFAFLLLGVFLTWGLLVGFADIVDSLAIIAYNSDKKETIYIEKETNKTVNPTPKANINNKSNLYKASSSSLDRMETTGLKIQGDDTYSSYTKEVYDYLK